jgi:hypothetical protein
MGRVQSLATGCSYLDIKKGQVGRWGRKPKKIKFYLKIFVVDIHSKGIDTDASEKTNVW